MSGLKKIHNPKWHSIRKAILLRQKLQHKNQTLVLTNGCFDLLHIGHIYFLEEASKLGEVLWVLLNSDNSIKKLKGTSRPIQTIDERAYALSALNCINGIIPFEAKRITMEIQTLKPDVYVKAGDYSLNTIDKTERQALETVGAKIQFLSFLPGYSTTTLIERIYRSAAPQSQHDSTTE